MSSFVPRVPFEGFKWKWATLQCTEGINNPIVLLGVLDRMNNLDGSGLTFSSDRFAQELRELQADIDGRTLDGRGNRVRVNLASRSGSRNIMRNSQQYWKALGLIPADSHGTIELTPFGKLVADRKISQSEFAAITVRSFQLPNPFTSSKEERDLWSKANLKIYPLRLILSVAAQLHNQYGQGWLTANELARVIIPLSGCPEIPTTDYSKYVIEYRSKPSNFNNWPILTPEANDMRIVREFLLFLAYHGYLKWPPIGDTSTRFEQHYSYASELDEEIEELLAPDFSGDVQTGSIFFESGFQTLRDQIRLTSVVSDIDRQRVQSRRPRRGQAEFRNALLRVQPRCVISNVDMPEILEAAHIIPDAYNGPMDVSNGIPLRMDIHKLYDLDMLRIAPDGRIDLSDRARANYGAVIPPRVFIPDYVNQDYLRWRWENYHGL